MLKDPNDAVMTPTCFSVGNLKKNTWNLETRISYRELLSRRLPAVFAALDREMLSKCLDRLNEAGCTTPRCSVQLIIMFCDIR